MFARIVKKSIVHNPRRLAVALAALVVPAALVTAVANFALDARAKMRTELRSRGPNLVVMGDADVPGLVARRSVSTATVGDVEITVVGADAAIRELHPGWRLDGAWGTVAGVRLASRLKLAIGDRVLGRALDGIVETGEPEDDVLFVARDPSAPVARIDARVPGDVAEVEAVAARIGVEARVQRALAASEGAILGKLTLAFALVGLLVGAVSALSMAMSLAAGVTQRRAEFALLRALGAGDGGIVRLLAAEVASLLGVGLVAGAAAGLALSQALGSAVFGQSVAVRPAAIAVAVVACAAIAAAGSVLPVRRALAVEPALALKDE
jgi:putative ABC transport system permease protein